MMIAKIAAMFTLQPAIVTGAVRIPNTTEYLRIYSQEVLAESTEATTVSLAVKRIWIHMVALVSSDTVTLVKVVYCQMTCVTMTENITVTPAITIMSMIVATVAI